MSSVLVLVGFAALLIGALGVVKGGVAGVGLIGRKQSAWAVAGAFAVMAAGAAMAPAQPAAQPASAEKSSDEAAGAGAQQPEVTSQALPPLPSASASRVATKAARTAPATPSLAASPRAGASSSLGPLLLMASGGDGDSWHDTRGVEYRMGLINTPETSECGGSMATEYRKRKLSAGFYARSYATDKYGRRVAVIYTQSGANLNVLMAREGIANDKYLAEFRHENPKLARQLDAAFARAKADSAGIWGSCSTRSDGASSEPAAPQPVADTSSRCHPDYRTCVPIKGDGSGQGATNDLDCGDIRKVVYLRSVGRDPYRLDANDDGVGCESYG